MVERPRPLRDRTGVASSRKSTLPICPSGQSRGDATGQSSCSAGRYPLYRHSLHEATMRRLSLVLLAVTLCATPANAQTVDIPVQSNVLAINPFGFLFQWYNIEYERAFSST